MLRSIVRTAAEKFLGNYLNWIVPALFPYTLIDRDGEPFFYRYYPHEDNDIFGWYIHKFVDGDAPNEVHTHPWKWAVSIILTSGYWEIRYRAFCDFVTGQRVQLQDKQELFHRPFSINVLQQGDLHRVMLSGRQPTWTIFIHGPRAGKWAFVNEETGVCREVTRRTRDRIVKT